ncbi:GrpB family protein, partial [Enterococcus faecalis]|nr:GrpB family protein [Enterococcus faecalis]
MRVIVTEYQPAWVEQFEEEAQALKQILKENCLKVEHIGSTSVPNLAAKPIIDF